ncbi:signal peptidase I [Campylobacter geochelonis]|uniref:Signal peptidase I n=1 Tax=Campylobacter geochelonis TaxID=1780362 RepID=A0A128EHR3_9BACT|nr:signal peptidase I [Campylobacter geochelonis]QKF71640.1 leader peptidase (signal peptidase I) [Campylobacter geochelonis]CZE48374.1 signal peptidase I [Campylobacter geochelonis]CZE49383.1 signal peptidase I [Campylobacter geochelonis]CZE51552.1 signal peptidase I [Campylobacter geochelonis]
MKKIFSKIYDFSSSWTGTIIIVLFVIFFVAQAFVIPSGSMKNTLLVGDFLFVKKFSYGIPTPHIPWLEVPVAPDFDGDGHILKGDMPRRGDIVVFRYPPDPKLHFVKRNFAVGGDEVIFTSKSMYLRPHEGDKYIDENYDKKDIVILNGVKFVKEPYKFKGIHYSDKIDILPTTIRALESGKFSMQPMYVKELPQLYSGLDFNAYYKKVPNGEFFMIGDNRDDSNDSRFWGSVPYKFIVGKPWFIYFSWDKNKKIRWERIGRFVDTVQNNEKFIHEQP